MKRELWETVAELIEALAVPRASALGLNVSAMKVDLPTELVVVQTDVGFQLLVDAPHYRWDAGLRPETGRLQLAVRRVDADETAVFAAFGSKNANLED